MAKDAPDAEEFDEFSKDNWGPDEEDAPDASLWVEDWDDDAVSREPLTASKNLFGDLGGVVYLYGPGIGL